MKRFAEAIIKFRWLVIGITIAITVLSAFSFFNFSINPDVTQYLPNSDKSVQLFNRISEEYGSNESALILFKSDSLFTDSVMNILSAVTDSLENIPGIRAVTSLANMMNIRDVDGIIMIDQLVNIPEKGDAFKEFIMSEEMYADNIVSKSGKSTIIICDLESDVDPIEVTKAIKALLDRQEGEYHYGGFPFMMGSLDDMIKKDLRILMPLSAIMMIIVLLLSFHSLKGIILPLLSVGISIMWVIGLMNLLNVQFTIISNLIPVIILAVGSAYSIHVLSRYNEVFSANQDRKKALAIALSGIFSSVMLAALTTMTGFLAFIFGSYLTMIREFGIFTAMGVLFSFIISVTLVPAVLSFMPQKVQKKSISGRNLLSSTNNWIIRRPGTVIIIGIVIIAIFTVFTFNVKRQANIMHYFRDNADIRISDNMLQEDFGGSDFIQIAVSGDMKDPAVLNAIDQFEGQIKGIKGISATQSIIPIIKKMNSLMGEGRIVPDSEAKVSNLWFLLDGEQAIKRMVNPYKTETIIMARVSSGQDTRNIEKILNKIEAVINDMNSDIVTFEATGMPSIHVSLDRSIIKSLFTSMCIAIALIFIILLILLKNFAGALAGMIPVGFTLIVVFGFMGMSGFTLDIATALVGSISIGIGIDYTIHFLTRFRTEKKSLSTADALSMTLKHTGRAIFINMFTVIAGFIVLTAAMLMPVARFGILISITMLSSAAGAASLLPAVILKSKIHLTRQGGKG